MALVNLDEQFVEFSHNRITILAADVHSYVAIAMHTCVLQNVRRDGSLALRKSWQQPWPATQLYYGGICLIQSIHYRFQFDVLECELHHAKSYMHVQPCILLPHLYSFTTTYIYSQLLLVEITLEYSYRWHIQLHSYFRFVYRVSSVDFSCPQLSHGYQQLAGSSIQTAVHAGMKFHDALMPSY